MSGDLVALERHAATFCEQFGGTIEVFERDGGYWISGCTPSGEGWHIGKAAFDECWHLIDGLKIGYEIGICEVREHLSTIKGW